MPQSDLARPEHSTTPNPSARSDKTCTPPQADTITLESTNGNAQNVENREDGTVESSSLEHVATNGAVQGVHEARVGKKRKLGEVETPDKDKTSKPISPPWKKVAVDGPTAITIDGRRVSARRNPSVAVSADDAPETPVTIKKEKAPSPPWKQIAVDGPTARFVNGRRVSSRVALPAQSEDAVPSPRPSSSKRPSPPRKKLAVEGPTAMLVDGRRVSSRTNSLSEPRDIESPHRASLARAVSPPWKKIEAEGPTSVIIDGRRKSTRTVAAEEDTPPKKKPVRPPKPSQTKQNGSSTPKSQHQIKNNGRKSERKRVDTRALKSPTSRRLRHPIAELEDSSTGRHGNSRVSRALLESHEEHTYSKLKIRVRGEPVLHQHPTHFVRGKTHESFDEWLKADDPLAGESLPTTNEDILKEAAMRLNIIHASEDNGVLSDSRCQRFAMRPFPEPLRKYGHRDHIANHASYFALLRSKEIKQHMKDAKDVAKWAETAVATDPRWAFLREAKSTEQIFKEESAYSKKRYAQLMKDLTASWNLVRQEVDRIKFAQWEKEQDALGKKHLDEMLDHSKHVLDQQFRDPSTDVTSDVYDSRRPSVAFEDSEALTDEEVEQSAILAVEDEDDENLSESSDEEEAENQVDDDQGLTQDQLREKYARALEQEAPFDASDEDEDEDEDEEDEEAESNTADSGDEDEMNIIQDRQPSVSELAPDDSNTIYEGIEIDEVDANLLDASDESTDMSSNMGDTDGEDDDNDDRSDVESSEDDTGVSGLAGFFFSKEELVEAKKNADLESPQIHSNSANHDDAADHDETESTNGAHEDEARTTIPIQVNGVAPSSDKASEVELSAASTPWPDQDGAVSTPTTSIIPGTPRRLRTEVSPLLRGTLREYQHDGVDWLANLYSGGRNGILADEMGLGKTIQTIALLAHLATHHEVWGPHLVVVPTSVMLNWEMEFKKWCPSFKILTYYGDINERKRKRKGWNNDDMWNVCITSYNIILQDQQVFKRRGWHYLVLDEAHNIKNFQSQRWQTLLTFRTHSRLLLTGTPLQNNLQELWSLLYFLMPAGVDGDGFADLEKFLNTMKRPADQILDQGRQELDPEAQARVSKLHEILRPFLLRRLKADVEKQMPSKYEHVVYCRLSKRQRQLYDEFMGRADTKRTLSSGNYMSIINCLMSLRKVCNHPDLFETRQIVTSFAMPRSAVAAYEIKDFVVRRNLLSKASLDLDFSGLLPAAHETNRKRHVARLVQLQASKQLQQLATKEMARLEALQRDDEQGAKSVIRRMTIEAQKNIVAELLNRAEHVKRATDRPPIYGADLLDLIKMPNPLDPPRPSRRRPDYTWGSWFLDKSTTIESMIPTVQDVSLRTTELITKFSCVTPAVVAEDVLDRTLTQSGRKIIEEVQDLVPSIDPYHEPRIRQSIAFPDKRLLQFDCGKLQALDKLLRDLQTGGHRCLIFTQMTRVLDILEQFLNIHGHRYLRLDGSTKVEQRQILTDRFNQDTRILAFILSSRSGGLGINLTGADTVIFYDLDWNPAMDKQCQDRCHRIGQTRDVHIYRFVSEYTIEANILRKSNQKRLLDDVIIQRGDFTTDMFERVTYKDALDDMIAVEDRTSSDANASAALDKFLGNIGELGNVLDNVEDKEDAAAAKAAQKEAVLGDGVDFDENTAAAQASAMAANPNAVLDAETAVENDEKPHVDEYMVKFMQEEMKWDPIRLAKPSAPKRSKKVPDWRRKR
jgi:helicase SWR1